MEAIGAITGVVNELLKVANFAGKLGGSHTPKHRREVAAKRLKFVKPVAKRIVKASAVRHRKVLKSNKRKSASGKTKMIRGRKRARGNGNGPTRGGSHTGGTGDLKPQVMTLSTVPSTVVSTYARARLSLPVNQFGGQKNRATIMEILRVDWYPNIIDLVDDDHREIFYLSTTPIRENAELCTLQTMSADFANTLTIAAGMSHFKLAGTAGALWHEYPISIDMTDHNGNGVLVATDQIFVTGGNENGSTLGGIYTCKVLYRLVNVGITEYVGIIQSQQ